MQQAMKCHPHMDTAEAYVSLDEYRTRLCRSCKSRVNNYCSIGLKKDGPLRTERQDRKAEGKASINDRPKLGPRVKNMENLARKLRKSAGYMLPSFVYPATSSTKLAAFARSCAKRAGYAFTIFNPRRANMLMNTCLPRTETRGG